MMNAFAQPKLFAAAARRFFDVVNLRLGLDEPLSVKSGTPVPASLRDCAAFTGLESTLLVERERAGKHVQMLMLKPPGDVTIPLAASVWTEILSGLARNAVEANANSICFSSYVNQGYLWLEVSDNGWGFPAAVRRQMRAGQALPGGLKFAHDHLAALGGGFRLGDPKAGSLVLLRIPLVKSTQTF